MDEVEEVLIKEIETFKEQAAPHTRREEAYPPEKAYCQASFGGWPKSKSNEGKKGPF